MPINPVAQQHFQTVVQILNKAAPKVDPAVLPPGMFPDVMSVLNDAFPKALVEAEAGVAALGAAAPRAAVDSASAGLALLKDPDSSSLDMFGTVMEVRGHFEAALGA